MKDLLDLQTGECVLIYYSRAQEDLGLQERLDQQLAVLYRRKLITSWHEGKILVGTEIEPESTSYLEKAHIILLLLSPNYLATDRCYAQMERAVQRHQTSGVHVLPVLLRPITGWEQTEASKLPAHLLPLGGRPVTLWSHQDEAFANVAAEIARLVEQVIEQNKRVSSSILWRRNIPSSHQHTSILPRSDVLQEIYTKLTQPDLSALILTGLCGSGKTTLAEQVYHHVEELRRTGQSPFTHETLWISIQPAMSLIDLVTTIAMARGHHVSRLSDLSPQELARELLLLLNSEDIHQLIILDQFEQWLDGQHGTVLTSHPAVKEWLTQINNRPCHSRLLLTSRLQLQETGLYPPKYLQEMLLPSLTSSDGVALLRLWGRQETEHTLAQAVKRCEGHIQAMALLVALLHRYQIRLSTLLNDPTYQRLWTKEMDQNLFNEYYTSLDEIARQLLLAFACYREPVPRQAVHAILSRLDVVTEEQTLQAINTLLSHHLLSTTGQNERYALHPLVADFVQTRQAGSTDQQRAHTAAAHYYQQCYALLPITRESRRPEDVDLLVKAVWHYCQARAWNEGYALIEQERLFTDLLRWGEYVALEEIYHLLASDEGWQSTPRLVAQFANELGELHNTLVSVPSSGSRKDIDSHHLPEGNVYRPNPNESSGNALGHKREALDDFTKALAEARTAEARDLQIRILNNMGATQRALGQLDQALVCYEEAQSLQESTTDVCDAVQKGITWNNLGRTLFSQAMAQSRQKEKQRLYRRIRTCYEQALQVYEAIHDEAEMGITLNNLGEMYAALGQHDQAFTSYRKALRYFRALRERPGEGIVCNNLGVLYHQVGRLQEAFDYYVQSLSITHELRSAWEEVTVLRNLGRLFIEAQDNDVALACFILARDLAAALGQPERGIIPRGLLAFITPKDYKKREQVLERLQPQAAQLLENALSHGLSQASSTQNTIQKEHP